MSAEADRNKRGARGLVLGAVFGAAITVALLSTGRGVEAPAGPELPRPAGKPRADAEVLAAASYDELLARRSVGRDVAELLARLPAGGGQPIVHGAGRRAFVGAPPVIPHAVDPRGSAGCRVCHDQGMAFPGGVAAPRMSHEPLAVCTQCHVPAIAGLVVGEPVDGG